MRTRELTDPATNKIWITQCHNANVLVKSGIKGKEKVTEKPQSDKESALAWAEKEEWSKLKKGFVLKNPAAKAGEPKLHFYRGGSYTGALAICNMEGKILYNAYDKSVNNDTLFLISRDAEILNLPKLEDDSLIWKSCYNSELKKLILLSNHQILSLGDGDTTYTHLSKDNPNPVSCLNILNRLAAWYEEPNLVVTNLANNKIILRMPLEYQLYSGHTSQMAAAISDDEKTLACCVNAGEILLIDINTGKIQQKINDKFEMITDLEFSPDGKNLLATEQYGEWRLLCFDLNNLSINNNWLKIKKSNITKFSINSASNKIAVQQVNNINIYDIDSLQQQLSIPVEHCVKNFNMTWLNNDIAVSTDYGCVSIYATE